ncbi:tetratricopeptide repeat protein [Neisseria lisongii]|uniref:Sel1 repeat family protein n=1 Tax=Neisseria lisongii TaxID=2912188 RepID=A0AAW5ACY3_9NEIS|nr:tetratricopeptide repeat protein [Neisseria lisongii]MCF7529169.1 sel1 repeat family protein [Neisseria lisongii]
MKPYTQTTLSALFAACALAFSLPAAADDTTQFNQADQAYQKQDYATAFNLWMPLAQKGNKVAQFNIGLMYDQGWGVKQDYAQAMQWYQKAAQQGDTKAQTNIGGLYANGQGVKQDYAQAMQWYLKAAQQGDAYAQYSIGVLYAKGQGVARDFQQARYWWGLAAKQGDQDAIEGLKKLDQINAKLFRRPSAAITRPDSFPGWRASG